MVDAAMATVGIALTVNVADGIDDAVGLDEFIETVYVPLGALFGIPTDVNIVAVLPFPEAGAVLEVNVVVVVKLLALLINTAV
ncbi:hypothetical protein GCM10023189_55170 [Nibrella saemangeumensis]|uniref:Uncharacterized protein n=1 Tax=Nibrella saemangeumensis TaxID=1084526 RepID=A0ABP8NQ28_9BACT